MQMRIFVVTKSHWNGSNHVRARGARALLVRPTKERLLVLIRLSEAPVAQSRCRLPLGGEFLLVVVRVLGQPN